MVAGVIIGLFILFGGTVGLAAECNDKGAKASAWLMVVILVVIGIVFVHQDNKLVDLENLRNSEIVALCEHIQELEAKAIAAGVATRVPVKVVENTVFMFNADMVAEASGTETPSTAAAPPNELASETGGVK